MGASKDAAKAAKKSAKNQLKQVKRAAGAGSSDTPASASHAGGPTPAERSATAAERQVRLQSLRVILAFLGVAATVAALLLTYKPWERGAVGDSEVATTQSGERP